jgi:hypothetical protein
MFNDFKDNRTYALAWVFTAVALAFAIAINVHVSQGLQPRGVSVPANSGK